MADKQPAVTAVTTAAVNSPSVPVSTPLPSSWDRLSAWAAENKAVVYTLATATVIATGASVYYLSHSPDTPTPTPRNRRSSRTQSKRKQTKTSPPAELAESDKNKLNTTARAEKTTKPKDPAAIARAESEEAAQQFSKALSRQGKELYEKKDLQGSLVAYTAVCLFDQFSNNDSSLLVEKILKEISYKKAKQIITNRKAKKLLPSTTFISNYLRSFRQQSRPAELADSVELDENSGMFYLRRGLAALEEPTRDKYSLAVDDFHKAVEKGDLKGRLLALALNMRGTFHYLIGDNEAALKDFDLSIKTDPKMVQTYVKLSTLHLELSNPKQAFSDLELAVRVDPTDMDIYYHRAQMQFVLGNHAAAIADYEESIRRSSPGDPFVYSHIQLGVAQYKNGQLDASNKTFEECLKRFPDASDVHNYYGEILIDQEEFAKAIKHFSIAVSIEKEKNLTCMNVLPIINKALTFFLGRQGENPGDTAISVCKSALLIDPACDIAYATLAQLYLQLGHTPEALVNFEKAAELCRTETEISNAISYAEATRAQLMVAEQYPGLRGLPGVEFPTPDMDA